MLGKTNCVNLKKNLNGKRSNSKHLRQDSLPERRRGRGVKRIPTLRYNQTRKKFSSRLNNGQTTRSIKGAPRVGRGSDTNLSRPICDPIQKELEGPTKDRPAYWNAFARWISLHQHYMIDVDTYKRHTMPHEYNIILQEINIRLWMEHKQKLKRHPPCQPWLPTRNLSPDRRRSRRRTPKQANITLTS